VVWETAAAEGAAWDVFGQAFENSGRLLRGPFEVPASTHLDQIDPVVACGSDETLIIAWSSAVHQQSAEHEIYARLFTIDGVAASPELRVNADSRFDQRHPAVAMSQQGGFTVVWLSSTHDLVGVVGRHFGRSGQPIGKEFRVDTYAKPYSLAGHGPRIAWSPRNGFLVVWQGQDPASDSPGVFGRFYEPERSLPIEVESPLSPGSELAQFPGVFSESGNSYSLVWIGNRTESGRTLWLRRLVQPELPSSPLTPEEVSCETRRLDLALQRVAHGPLPAKKICGILLFPDREGFAGLVDLAEGAAGNKLRWSMDLAHSFAVSATGRVSMAGSASEAPEIRWTPAGSSEIDVAITECASPLTAFDRARFQWLARQIRPQGSALGFALAIQRGEGVDTFRIHLFPEPPEAVRNPMTAEVRIIRDWEGRPVHVLLKRLTSCRSQSCTHGVSWGRETPILWFTAGRTESLRLDLEGEIGFQDGGSDSVPAWARALLSRP